MRTPLIAKNLEQAKEIANEFWKSKDWRFQFIAYYVLSFYLDSREIMEFLRVQPKVIREFMEVLPKIRKNPKLIRLNSLKEVMGKKVIGKIPQKKVGIEQVLGI